MPSRRRFLAGASATALGATAGCLDAVDPSYAGQDEPDTDWWPQPSFDSHGTCYNPDPVGPTDGVTERWAREISGPSARPVVADGTAFLPAADGVIAVDAATGEERWREEGDDPPLWPRDVRYHDGRVYVAAVEETGLLALDAETGERQWTFSPPDPEHGIRTLLVDPHRDHPDLYGGSHGAVYRFDPDTGERRWRREVFGVVQEMVVSPHLLVATEGGEVYSLSSDDGTGYWRRNLNGMVTTLGTTSGGGPYVSLFGGPTYRLDDHGATDWKRDGWSSDSFVLTYETLFATGQRLTARNVRDGSARWTGGATTQCGPAATGDTVYAASGDAVTAYDFGGGRGIGPVRIGTRRWNHSVEGRPEQGLAVADGAVFVLTEGGSDERSMAYALEAA